MESTCYSLKCLYSYVAAVYIIFIVTVMVYSCYKRQVRFPILLASSFSSAATLASIFSQSMAI